MNIMNKVEIRSSGFKPSPKLRTHIINNLARLFRHEKEIERVLLYISKEVMGKTQKQYSLVGRVAVPGPDLVIENRGENLESVYHRCLTQNGPCDPETISQMPIEDAVWTTS